MLPSSRTHAVDPELERRSVSCHRASTSPLLLAALLLMAFHDELAARSVSSPLRHPKALLSSLRSPPASMPHHAAGSTTRSRRRRPSVPPGLYPRPPLPSSPPPHFPSRRSLLSLPLHFLSPEPSFSLRLEHYRRHHCRRQAKPPRSPFLRYSSVPIDPTETFLMAP